VRAVTALWFDVVLSVKLVHGIQNGVPSISGKATASLRGAAMRGWPWTLQAGRATLAVLRRGPHVKISSRAAIYHVDRLPTLWIKRIYFPAVPTGE
jgi:hypothetical protein